MNTSPETIDDARRAVPPAPAAPAPGAGPVRAWALPGAPGCARHARTVIGDALGRLGLPRDAIGDAQLMISELATNAYQHAGSHSPHELWLYPGEPAAPGPPEGAAREVRCAVFDAFACARLPTYSWTSGDCGRGIGIVRELSGGRWGTLRTVSRLGPPVQGKAVWFAVPAPGGLGALHVTSASAAFAASPAFSL